MSNNIQQEHYDEWVIGSGVHPDLVALNVQSLSGDEGYDCLLYGDNIPRRNDGRLRDGILKRYRHIEAGGWWCSGIDPLTGEDANWGCFKPDKPRLSQDGKIIKYEHPFKIATELFCLKVSWQVGFIIAKNHGLQKQYAARILKAYQERQEAEGRRQEAGGRGQEAEGRRQEENCPIPPQQLESSHLRKFFSKRNQKRDLTAHQEADLLKLPHLSQVDDKFWQWVKEQKLPIIITEGAKKAATFLTCGQIAIALPGIYNGYRVPKDELGTKTGNPSLIPQLAHFTQEGQKFIFGFDQDEKPKTIMNVRKALAQTAKLLIANQCECFVARWSGAKGIDDLLVTQGFEEIKRVVSEAVSYFGWLADGYRQLTYPVAQSIDPTLRYLPTIQVPDHAQVIAVKAHKGRGKTKTVGDWLKKWNLPCLILGHRNNLLDDLARRFGIISNGNLRSPESQEILIERLCRKLGISSLDFLELPLTETENQPTQLSLLEEPEEETIEPEQKTLLKLAYSKAGISGLNDLRDVLGFCLCADSLHDKSLAGFRPEQWGNCVLFLDEIEQVLWHCLNGQTDIKKYRVKILQNLRELVLQVYHSPKGRIVVADADLSDLTIEWLKGILGDDVAIHLIEQKVQLTPQEIWNVFVYNQSTPYQLLVDLNEAISQGEKPFICLSGQDTATLAGTENLEAQLQKNFPFLSILRIDSQSLKDPTHPAFGCISNLNEVIKDYSVVICSPAIETGVSIDNRGHFTSVWGIAGGITLDNSFCQALARLRENVPRYLWAAQTGLNFIGEGVTETELLASDGINHSLRLILQGDTWDYDAISFYDQNQGNKAVWYPIWLKYAQRCNFVMANYGRSVLELLRREGHRIHIAGESGLDAVGFRDLLKETRFERYEAKCVAVSEVEKPSEGELKQLNSLPYPTPEQLLKKEKGVLCNLYKTDNITPEIVKFHDKGGYKKLRTLYFLTLGQEYLNGRDRYILEQHLINGQGQLWLPDLERRLMSKNIFKLVAFGIPALLLKDRLSQNDPDLIALKERCLQYPETAKEFGIRVSEKTLPLTIYKAFLRFLGLDGALPELGRFGSREDRERYYSNPNLGWKEDTLQAWLSEDRERNSTNQSLVMKSHNSERGVEVMVEQAKGILTSLDQQARHFLDSVKLSDYLNKVEAFLTPFLDQLLEECPDFLTSFWEELSVCTQNL